MDPLDFNEVINTGEDDSCSGSGDHGHTEGQPWEDSVLDRSERLRVRSGWCGWRVVLFLSDRLGWVGWSSHTARQGSVLKAAGRDECQHIP